MVASATLACGRRSLEMAHRVDVVVGVHATQEIAMAKYGRTAAKTVKSALHRKKTGTLKSGSGQPVNSRAQAIAIALNEAREKGGKVPKRSAKKTSAKKASAKRGSAKKAAKKRPAKTSSTRKPARSR